MNSVLSIRNLCKDYFNKNGCISAIKDLNLDVYDNEFISIVGPSGCGKSTLLSILAGIENYNSGNICLKNKKTGYMLQDSALFPWRTVLDNCLLGLEIKNDINREKINEVISLINSYGLGKFINNYPNSLSGGMKQRVSLIRTLATDPDILLLDEPFSKLDYVTRVSLSEDLYRTFKNTKKTIILVTHDIAEAISLSDRIIVLSKQPSHVKMIYKIEFSDNYSPIERRRLPEFNYYYDLIWRNLDVHI